MKKFLTILAAAFLLTACKSNTPPDSVKPGSTEAGGAPIINAVPALKPDGTPYDVEEMIVNPEYGVQTGGDGLE